MGALITLLCAYTLLQTLPAWAVRRPVFPDEYGQQAWHNLTEFRSQLMSKWLARQAVRQNQPRSGRYNEVNIGHERYHLYNPVITCPPWAPMLRYGGFGDGGKWLCTLKTLKAPCVIYSLGYGGNMDFERAMLDSTPCSVHTFDCTRRPNATLGDRHIFHDVCIGTEVMGHTNQANWTITPYRQVVATLGHARVDILKIDIEGSEYNLISSLHELDAHLPRQLAIEFHLQDVDFQMLPVKDDIGLAGFLLHLANLGYASFSREDNHWGHCCSELSFLRVEEPVSHSAAAPGGVRHLAGAATHPRAQA